MKTYHYDEHTKEYTHSEKAFLDPLESKKEGSPVYLLPANATFVAPTPQDGYASVWNGEAWDNIEDNRGKKYWLSTDPYGTPAREMTKLGALPDGVLFTAPIKTLSEAQEDAIYLLKQARDTAEVEPIEVGGNTYDYDDKARERINAAIVALDGTNQTLSWTTADNKEAIVNADDLKNIVRAVAVRSNILHTKYREKKEEVKGAKTVTEVEKIRW